jgi:hypothetical protein
MYSTSSPPELSVLAVKEISVPFVKMIEIESVTTLLCVTQQTTNYLWKHKWITKDIGLESTGS